MKNDNQTQQLMIHPLSLQYVEVVRQEIKPNRFNLRLHYNIVPTYNGNYNIVPEKLGK